MKSIKKVDAMRKLNGEVLFIDDIQDANLLHAKFIYSSKAHAKVNKINFPKGTSSFLWTPKICREKIWLKIL